MIFVKQKKNVLPSVGHCCALDRSSFKAEIRGGRGRSRHVWVEDGAHTLGPQSTSDSLVASGTCGEGIDPH
jgi:hypothetical protein